MSFDHGAQRIFQGFEEHVGEMTRNIHEFEIGLTDELDFGGFEQAIMVFTDKARIVDGFLGEVLHVGFGANHAHIIWLQVLLLIRECNMLADEHADADAGHVEAVEEGLDVGVDLHALPLPLVLENPLGYGCDDTVVSPFDDLERFGKALVIISQLGGPVDAVVGRGVVPSRRGRCGLGDAISGVGFGMRDGLVLALADAGVGGGLAQDFGLAVLFVGRSQEALFDVRVELRFG